VGEYVAKQLPETPEREDLLGRLVAMHQAALEIEELHEDFLGSTGGGSARAGTTSGDGTAWRSTIVRHYRLEAEAGARS
jgi:hypothetical protein